MLETFMVYPNVFYNPPDSLKAGLEFMRVRTPHDFYPPLGFCSWLLVDAQRRNQILMLELGDELVRRTLTALELRSGKPIEFRDEESRKWSR